MADLVLVHSPDPAALLAHVARPFCVRGRTAGPLPLVAVRQGGVRDALLDRAARAGCAGWLGAPVVIFRELPELLAGPLAPLTVFERHALLVRALGAAGRGALVAAGDGRGRPARGVLRMLDAFVGDLRAERVAPADAAAAFAGLHAASGTDEDAWARLRDAEVAGVYAAYVAKLEALPPLGGRARSDGRDATACAAEALAADPDAVCARLREPFGPAGARRTVCLHGLNDLRGGWGRLVRALHEAAFVDELRVSVLADDVPAAAARHAAVLASDDPWAAAADGAEPTGEDALAHALLAQAHALGAPARIERAAPDAQLDAECGARPAALAHVQATLFGAAFGAAAARVPAPLQGDAPAAVRAVAAPDVAREADLVARRVKRLLVEGDGAGPVAPHRVLVVSRQARPYGERVAEALRRHGVPVTARLRVALPRVGAVGALLRLVEAAAAGWSPTSLGALAASPYVETGLDAAGLAAVARRRGWPAGRGVPLAGWVAAIGAMCDEVDEDERAPSALGGGRAEALRDAFAAFARVMREPAGGDAAEPRGRGAWVDLALQWLAGEGVFGLCRAACRLPHDEADALAVDAVRRDAEGLAAVGGALAAWRAALALGAGVGDDAAGEVLSAAAWRHELAAALEDEDLALTTPHRRGVQVAEAAAAAWRTCDHLFVVGMQAGSFPAEPAGVLLFGADERRALERAGLPAGAPEGWAAREASLWRTLVAGAARSLHLSYAAGDARGRAQLPAAYFDDAVSRLAGPDLAGADAGAPEAWVERRPTSEFVPNDVADAWCAADLHLVAAARAAAESADARVESRRVLAHLASDPREGALAARVLAAAARERARRALRLAPPALPRESARPWNGAVTSLDLGAWLAGRYGDRVWSATELERYGRCPWDFFAHDVLGVREPDAPAEDGEEGAAGIGGGARGTLIHRVLELLHRDLADAHGDAALSGAALRRADRLVPHLVERALAEAVAEGRGVPFGGRAVVAAELAETVREYVAWEVAENEKAQRAATPPRRPVAFEVAFGVGGRPPVTLTHGGRTLRLRGRIDRVDALVGDAAVAGRTYVVDYKTSKASLTPVRLYEDGAILQLPLYVHVLGRLTEGGAGVWGGAYQVVQNGGERPGALHPSTLVKGKVRRGELKGEQEAEARLHDALAYALLHVDGVVAGAFPARIPASTPSCPPFCAVRDACREVRA